MVTITISMIAMASIRDAAGAPRAGRPTASIRSPPPPRRPENSGSARRRRARHRSTPARSRAKKRHDQQAKDRRDRSREGRRGGGRHRARYWTTLVPGRTLAQRHGRSRNPPRRASPALEPARDAANGDAAAEAHGAELEEGQEDGRKPRRGSAGGARLGHDSGDGKVQALSCFNRPKKSTAPQCSMKSPSFTPGCGRVPDHFLVGRRHAEIVALLGAAPHQNWAATRSPAANADVGRQRHIGKALKRAAK